MQELNPFDYEMKTKLEIMRDKEFVGRALLPFSLLSKSIIIYDEQNLPIYQISGSSIQC